MSSTLLLKKSSVVAKVPAVGDLVYGELALNYADGKLYYKTASNTIDAFSSGAAAVLSVAGNVGDITATQLLTAVKTVDGGGSGLDADLLDGQHGTYYLDWTNTTNKPDPVVTVTLTGDVTGTGNATLTDLASGTISFATTIAANSVVLGTDTTGNYASSVGISGPGLSITGIAGEGTAFTVNSLATTIGGNLFTLTNPSAITFPRFNADNTVSTLSAVDFRTATGSGTVTSVGGTGTVSGLTLTGTVTTSGNLTLGGTLAVTPGNFASQTANTILAAPNGSAGVPTFRILASADIPSLDASKITTGVFDAARLPSYVDDVLEYANLAAFPATGTTGKIYIALDTNKTYRWSGTVYVYITSGAVDSVGGATGVVTATNLLDSIKTVDGAASGLDADLLDGNHASAFYLATNPSGYTTNTGTVTSFTFTNGNGITGTVSTATTTPTLSFALGAVTGTSFNSITGLSSTTPAALGTAAVGTSTTVARSDHVHLLPSLATLGAAAVGQTMYIGTTAVAINRASAAQTLAGITLTTPNIGVATGTSFNSITGLASVAPLIAGAAAVGTSTLTARQDHVHPVQTTVSGTSGSTVAAVTFNNAGAGAVSGTTFNGSTAQTISYNTIGAYAASNPSGYTTNTGTVTSVATSSPLTGGTITGTGTIGIQVANTSQSGYLTSTDWNTFNNKQPSGSYLTSESDTLATVTGRGASTATHVTMSGGWNDGYITYNAAQINRSGSQIELQFAGAAGSTVGIGANGPKPIIFNANTGDGAFAGAISAATKSFLIKHPTKPDMQLRYGSLESPYHGVRLTGEGEVVNGQCVIHLPDYIHGLCKQEGSQVQITNIKHNKVLWVEDIVVDKDYFIVMCDVGMFDRKTYKFFWSFTAVRKDISDLEVETV